jgi:hypothetical protein
VKDQGKSALIHKAIFIFPADQVSYPASDGNNPATAYAAELGSQRPINLSASLLIDQDMTPKQVQMRMGHSSIR